MHARSRNLTVSEAELSFGFSMGLLHLFVRLSTSRPRAEEAWNLCFFSPDTGILHFRLFFLVRSGGEIGIVGSHLAETIQKSFGILGTSP